MSGRGTLGKGGNLEPIEIGQLLFAVQLEGNWRPAQQACSTVKQGSLPLVQLLVQFETLHTPALGL